MLDVPNKRQGEPPAKAFARQILFELRFSKVRDLSRLPWPSVVEQAAKANNRTFFISLGKVLGRRPESRPEKRANVDWFLVNHWAWEWGEFPQLACLTWEAISQVCAVKCGQHSPQSIKMRAKRLKLKHLPKPYFTVDSMKPKITLRKVGQGGSKKRR